MISYTPEVLRLYPSGLNVLVTALGAEPAAAGVVDPLSQPVEAGQVSRDGLTAMVPVQLAARVTGEWPVWSDFNDTNEEALHRAELVSGIPTMILLFIAFGSAIAAGIPLILALAGIANTLSTAGKAVFLSALAVVMSLAAVFVVPVMVFRSMALGMVLSVVAVGLAAADPNVVDARVVAEPAETGRTAVRVTAATAVDAPAAQNHDLTEVLPGRAPLAIALMPILLNLLSVGASFGFATLVFQHGFGPSLIGIDHQGFVDAWAPLFFFALLFGLSMDYQLFLPAAIRERYEATGDTQLAIKEGIARTGRPITNPALVMIVVFIAFGITGPHPTDRARSDSRRSSGAGCHCGAHAARTVRHGSAGRAQLVATHMARTDPAEGPLLALNRCAIGAPTTGSLSLSSQRSLQAEETAVLVYPTGKAVARGNWNPLERLKGHDDLLRRRSP